MSTPLLSSAIEDYEHSLYHKKLGTPVDNKFAVIHMANAVELVLKEKILSKNESIFDKRRGENYYLSFQACIIKLEELEVILPDKSNIELLADERNLCVHTGRKPDAARVEWLLSIGQNFMRNFCEKELGIALSALVPEEEYQELEKIAKKMFVNTKYIYIIKAEESLHKKQYAQAVLDASNATESMIQQFLESEGKKPEIISLNLYNQFIDYTEGDKSIKYEISKLREIRNKTVHSIDFPITKELAEEAVSIMDKVVSIIQDIWLKKKKCVICGSSKIEGSQTLKNVDLDTIGKPKILTSLLFLIKGKKDTQGKISSYHCKDHPSYWAAK